MLQSGSKLPSVGATRKEYVNKVLTYSEILVVEIIEVFIKHPVL
jgi:hypothetical protein